MNRYTLVARYVSLIIGASKEKMNETLLTAFRSGRETDGSDLFLMEPGTENRSLPSKSICYIHLYYPFVFERE